MHDAAIHAQYATGKDGILTALTTKGADALVYHYVGQKPSDYRQVLDMPSRTDSLFSRILSKSDIANLQPTFAWSTTKAKNTSLHHVKGATSSKKKLVKVTIHRQSSKLTAEASARGEVGTHIAMVEYGSRYVPMLYDVACYVVEDKWVNIMIMEFVTGASLAKLYESRELEFHRKFVLGSERDQLREALKDLWAVGGAHMDLHRNNIIITDRGHLYIIDFSRSAKLDRHYYTQSLSLQNQRKRVAQIIGPDAPVLTTKEDILSAASHYLYAYPELFALQNMDSQQVKQKSSKAVRNITTRIKTVRQKVIPKWNKPDAGTWKLLQQKAALETKLNKAYGLHSARGLTND